MSEKSGAGLISFVGLAALAAVFALWWHGSSYGAAGYAAALVSVILFAAVCLRFVPVWIKSWEGETPCKVHEKPEHICGYIFAMIVLWDMLLVASVFFIRKVSGYSGSFSDSLNYWLYLDSHHYMDIARDWYLSEGELDRLVQLVFFPGYPVAVRLMHLLIPDYTVSGFLVSMLCFAGSGCMLYKLVLLDAPHETAVRAVRFFCILPPAFFFAAPMSESLFILCSLCCLYLVRRKRTFFGCVFGMYAAFTRSLGVLLLVPVFFELVSDRRRLKEYFEMLIIPLGFAAYLLINYLVAGDPFKFMEYQRSHWGQSFGWFFNTAAYQTEYAIRYFETGASSFFGLSLPNLAAQLISLCIMIPAAKRLRASYTAHFIAYYVVAIGATWLLSAPRYLAALTSLPIALSLLSEKKMTNTLLTILCLSMGLYYITAFCCQSQVW